jgi:hypothetical protein
VIGIAIIVVAIVVVLELAERVFAPDEPVGAESTPEEPARRQPLEVEVFIDDEDMVVVETADHQRTRVRTDGDTAAAEALADCIREEIDRVSQEPFSDEDRGEETVIIFGLVIQGHGSDPRVRRAVQKCVMGSIEGLPELPELPALPEPPGTN